MVGTCYLFAGGGTGGHLFPGIAVAEEIARRQPDARIVFAGSDRPLEQRILASTSFEHRILPAVQLTQAKRTPLRFLGGAMRARRAAARLLDDLEPAAVIGCGGYASAAPVYVAWRRRCPFVLLEQNTIPGRTTRWLSRLGGTVCLSYDLSERFFSRSARLMTTGNPVRMEIAELARSTAAVEADPKTLLVLGGSQGARALNELLIDFARHHADVLKGWRILHQTGNEDEQRVRSAYQAAGIPADVSAFFDHTPSCYQQATAVVCRSGATTLAEIACAGLPGILVPYPHAADDHQRQNATLVADATGMLIYDEHLRSPANQPTFAASLRTVLTNAGWRKKSRPLMQNLARPGAAGAVAEIVLNAATRAADHKHLPIDSLSMRAAGEPPKQSGDFEQDYGIARVPGTD